MKIFVTGVSGTGKSTVYSALRKRGVQTIGIDETPDLSYWINKNTKEKLTEKVDFSEEFLKNHEWVCNITLLKELIAKTGEPIVICGSVDNFSECMQLCDRTLLLECSPATFTARINARTDNEYGKGKETQDVLLGYYQEYNQECLDAGAISIDAEESIDEVVEKILGYTQ
ncbi:AAA family ATPase [Candidatus Pacebacteria bacterium]|nr:AAA family ATPase [Candidatus Paceibacterota bacterium]